MTDVAAGAKAISDIQGYRNLQEEYAIAKAEEASQKDTVQQAFATPETTPLADSYAPAEAPSTSTTTDATSAMVAPGAPTAQLSDGTTAPMPSFMAGTKAEEAPKDAAQKLAESAKPVAEAPKTPIMKLQQTQQVATGFQTLLKTNDNAIKIALAKGDHKFAQALAVQNEDLKKKQADAQVEHFKAVDGALTAGGQITDGYAAAMKANPNEAERNWQQYRMEMQLQGFPTQEIDAARTPEQRAAFVAKAQASAVTGKEKVQLEIAQLKFTAEQERTKQTALLTSRKLDQADRRLALGKGNMDLKARAETIMEIKLRRDSGKPISDAEAAFYNDETDLVGLLGNPDTAKAILGGKDVPATSTTPGTVETTSTPMQTTTPFASKIQKLEKSAPTAVSSKNAESSMQVIPSTQKDPGYGVTPAKDDSLAEKARVGNDYANAMLSNYSGNETLAAAAYNWGPAYVDKSIAYAKEHNILPEEQVYRDAPKETKNYLDRLNSNLPNTKPAIVADTGKTKGGEVLRPKLSSADIMRSQRTINAGNSTISVLETIKELPLNTSMGVLPNLTTKDGMVNAVRNMGGRTITNDSEDQLNTVFKGLGRDLAAVETGGLATGLTDLSKSLEQGLGINPGQATPFKIAMKLADVRRIVEEHLQPQIDSKTLTPDQIKSAEKIIAKLHVMVPYTTTDVAIATKKAQAPKAETIGAGTTKAVTGTPKVSAEQQATLNKYGL